MSWDVYRNIRVCVCDTLLQRSCLEKDDLPTHFHPSRTLLLSSCRALFWHGIRWFWSRCSIVSSTLVCRIGGQLFEYTSSPRSNKDKTGLGIVPSDPAWNRCQEVCWEEKEYGMILSALHNKCIVFCQIQIENEDARVWSSSMISTLASSINAGHFSKSS